MLRICIFVLLLIIIIIVNIIIIYTEVYVLSLVTEFLCLIISFKLMGNSPSVIKLYLKNSVSHPYRLWGPPSFLFDVFWGQSGRSLKLIFQCLVEPRLIVRETLRQLRMSLDVAVLTAI
jgi:hypothetical protein